MAEHQLPSAPPGRDRDVTASEVASYAYCAKAWYLRYVLHKEPSRLAIARQEAGVSAHESHGIAVRRLEWIERRAAGLAVALLVAAALLLALAMLWSCLGSAR